MRPHVSRARAVAGALFTTSCAATLPAAAHAQPDAAAPVLRADERVTAGARTTVTGKVPGYFGRTVALHHRAGAAGPWVQIATTQVGRGDRFALRVAVPRSGALRASVAAATEAAAASAPPTTNEKRVTVARAVRVGAKDLHVEHGRRAVVAGRLKPAARGVRVALQVRRDSRWKTLDRGRTRAGGRYRLRGAARSTGTRRARVLTGRGAGFAPGRRSIGRLRVYRVTYASWYGPGFYGRPLGCGGAPLQPGRLGVAHKTLPCGTKVTFRRGRRSVTVPVIDRGPYVAGREYDLTEATAQRLRFKGHGTILATR